MIEFHNPMFTPGGSLVIDFRHAMIVRRAAMVKRWHTHPMHREQTLAAHSHGVAMLVTLIEPQASANLLRAALVHDLGEFNTGDIPANAKVRSTQLRRSAEDMETAWLADFGFGYELTEHEGDLLKFCDYLELLLFSIEEMTMGNTYAVEPTENIIPVLSGMKPHNFTAEKILVQAVIKARQLMARLTSRED